MQSLNLKRTALAAALIAASILPAHAQLRITEVHASGSGNTTYMADWFELTNIGASAISIARMDDNSNSFASGAAFRGVTSILPGASVIFLEGNTAGTNDASINAAFIAAWFGGSAPSGLTIGNYGGSGVGLSTGGDAVNVYNTGGTLLANVTFASATAARTFDNAAKLNNAAISQLSTAGVNGAFNSLAGSEIGSPGRIANPVPEPETYALMLAGLGLVGFVARRRKKLTQAAIAA